MTATLPLGERIRVARIAKGWSRPRLAEEASKLQLVGCPKAEPMTDRTIVEVERRRSVRFDDPTDALPYVLRALGMGRDELGEAVGL
jgi:transcriptional regulator with XRE-family HTH domain